MTEWRSIESAPKDGSWLLLYAPGIERDYDAENAPQITVGTWNSQTYSEPVWLSAETEAEFWDYGGYTGAGMSVHLREIQPTHWMPCPDAPGG